MTESTGPLKLVPRYQEKPWGGRRLERTFGRGLAAGAKIGESWELYDRPDGAAEIANGPLAGRTVADLRGKRRIPLLTKIIDAMDTLSVQVHPDGEAASELDGEEKTEAWYVIDAEPGARIYKGLKDGVGVRDLLTALDRGTVPDLLHSFEPSPGDLVYLPAGTVHAIGAGVLLYEVQQNSDTTYRLYDWDRPGLDGKPRELHREPSIRSTDFSGPGLDRVEPRPIFDDGRYRRTMRVDCPAFAMEEQEILGLVTFETERRGGPRWHVVFVLSGEGTIRAFRRGAEEVFFAPGDSLLLPAEHERYEIEPRSGRTVRLLSACQP
ncbi:MAG: type I phosphomannose isomerase catalytic subunit [Planctomycetota bacterium]